MAHEILSVKLCQLDDRVGKLHTRIRMSETASPSQLKQEISMLKQECREGESVERNNHCIDGSRTISLADKMFLPNHRPFFRHFLFSHPDIKSSDMTQIVFNGSRRAFFFLKPKSKSMKIIRHDHAFHTSFPFLSDEMIPIPYSDHCLKSEFSCPP